MPDPAAAADPGVLGHQGGEGSFRDADEVRRGDYGDAVQMIDTLRAGLHRPCAQRAGRAAA